jgi:Fur family ferric uptake transcriptional regulator
MGVLRKTKSVKTLLAVFEHAENAFSVVDLVERFSSEMNKTTVYRILERLVEDGVLHSFQDQKGLKWYARCQGCSSGHHEDLHPHFQCKDCGKVECLNEAVAIPRIPKYKVESAEFLLVGQCEDCIS